MWWQLRDFRPCQSVVINLPKLVAPLFPRIRMIDTCQAWRFLKFWRTFLVLFSWKVWLDCVIKWGCIFRIHIVSRESSSPVSAPQLWSLVLYSPLDTILQEVINSCATQFHPFINYRLITDSAPHHISTTFTPVAVFRWIAPWSWKISL